MPEPADPAHSAAPPGAAPRAPLMPLLALIHAPFGTANGFLTVTLGYQMAHGGISTAAIGGVVALSASMLIWSVLWAPLLDLTFSYRRWFAGAALALGLAGHAAGRGGDRGCGHHPVRGRARGHPAGADGGRKPGGGRALGAAGGATRPHPPPSSRPSFSTSSGVVAL